MRSQAIKRAVQIGPLVSSLVSSPVLIRVLDFDKSPVEIQVKNSDNYHCDEICESFDTNSIVTALIENVRKIEHSRFLMTAWSKHHQNQDGIRFLYFHHDAKKK